MEDLVKWLRPHVAGEPHSDGSGTAILDAYSAAIKRRVAEGRNYGRWVDGEDERHYSEKVMSGPDDRTIPGLELAVKLIALAYQHRSGYREEWRP